MNSREVAALALGILVVLAILAWATFPRGPL